MPDALGPDALRPARISISGSERAPLTGATKAQPADPAERISVTAYLRPGQPLNAAVSDLASSTEGQRRYLSRDEFANSFGATPDDLSKARAFAADHELTVESADAGRRAVVLSGTVAAMSAAFGVELAQYDHPGGSYRGREGAITIPADLDGIITSVHGLDNRPAARPHFVPASTAPASTAPASTAQPLQANGPYSPVEVASAYSFPAGSTGQGECAGIIELGGGYLASDLTTFFHNNGIAEPTVVAVGVDGGTNSPGSDADGEVALDMQVIGAVSPGARIAVYFAPNSDQGFLDAITTAVHDTTNKPSVVSISWGQAEVDWSGQSMTAMDQAFQAAALLGVTITAASGDSGSGDGVSDGHAHADFPSSSPHALGCGGTTLSETGGHITSEVVWNSGGNATGGGISDVFGVPDYQSGAGIPPSANPGGRIGRGVPDVAGDADPATGYEIVLNGQTVVIGGTSAVAPLWAGLVARLNSAVGHPVGFLNPVLYAHPGALHQIISGNNGAYHAGPGWNACTGLGSPNGPLITQALTPGQLWHTIRNADGSWVPSFGLVESQEGNNPGTFTAVSAGGVGTQLEVVGVAGGQLWHTIRNADGTWAPSFGLVESQEGNNPGAFTAISAAGVGNQLEVVGVAGGQLWHTIRNADGSWAPSFGLVESQEGNNPGAFTAVSAAGVGNQLEVVGVAGGQLWHTIRNADGTWAPSFGLVESQEGNNPGTFTAISAAGVGTQLEVVGIAGGQLWHTIRNADGSWAPSFGLVESQEGNNPGAFTAVSAAGVGTQLEVVGVAGGQLWHTIRNADGTWAASFGLVESQEGNNPGAFTAVSAAGVGVQLEVVGVV
jgi:kumamolisin